MDNEEYEPKALEGEALEEILREFSSSSEDKGSDPALRSPVQRRRIVEEDFPERHIPAEHVESQEDSDSKTAPKMENVRKAEEPEVPPAEKPAGLPRLELNRKRTQKKSASRRRSMPRMDREPEFAEEPEEEPEQSRVRPRAIQTPENRWRSALEHQGSRNIRLILSAVFTVGALFLGFVRSQGLLDGYPNQNLFGLGEILLLLLCSGICYDVLAEGLEALLQPGFTLNTLAALETLAVLGQGFFAMLAQQPSYCPLQCLILTCALWGKRSRIQATAETMDTARKLEGSDALIRDPAFFQKMPAIRQGQGSIQEFLACNDKPVGPERFLNLYGVLVVLTGLAVAAICCRSSAGEFFRYWSAVMLAGTPLMSFLLWARPFAILAHKLSGRGAALYGWPGVRRLSGRVMMPVSAEDLFPKNNMKLNGVKYFNGFMPDRVVSVCAAATAAAGSALAPIFEEQLQLRGARRSSVTTLRRYDVGGISAEIGNDSVMVGSLRFMQSMGVEMPSGTRVSQAVYVAISGDLAGVFAISYGVMRQVMDQLAILGACRGVTPLVTAGDFNITEAFLQSKFHMNTAGARLPSMSTRAELNRREPRKNALPAAMVSEFDFGTRVNLLSGARALNMACHVGLALAILSSLMGIVMMTVLASLGADGVMSVANITLYLLIWSVPMFLLTGWPKNV